MAEKYKLRCFSCGVLFKAKAEVWRDAEGFPVHKDAIEEQVYDNFDFGEEYILSEIETRFNKNYRKYLDFVETKCQVCKSCNTIYELAKTNFSEDGVCEDCLDAIEDKKLEAVEA